MTRWGEIKCERCAEQDALWEGMERALEKSDAREARLEAKLAKAMEALKIDPWFIGYGGWKKHVKDTLAELKGQGDE